MRRKDKQRRRRRQPARTGTLQRRAVGGPIRVVLDAPDVVVLKHGESSVDLVADPQGSPDLLANFTRLPEVLSDFAEAVRDKDTALEAVAGLYALCRAAC